jgi:chorismate mutase / prephenate dehydratase
MTPIPIRTSYLGPPGTYSEEAARAYFGDGAEYVPADSPGEVLALAEHGQVGAAILPVENSIEGVVSQHLDLLQATSLQICGEIELPVHHMLLSRAPNLQHIVMVMAHPQALGQCRRWLDAHLPHADRQPATSNGEAARVAAQNPSLAAIAGMGAARTYDLPPLAQNIEDEPNNTTRFVVLGHHSTSPTGHDTTSIICSAPNRPGGLLHVLTILAKHNINMTKLVSRPVPKLLWNYVFYIDIDGHAAEAGPGAALRELREQGMLVKLLGSYRKVSQ